MFSNTSTCSAMLDFGLCVCEQQKQMINRQQLTDIYRAVHRYVQQRVLNENDDITSLRKI